MSKFEGIDQASLEQVCGGVDVRWAVDNDFVRANDLGGGKYSATVGGLTYTGSNYGADDGRQFAKDLGVVEAPSEAAYRGDSFAGGAYSFGDDGSVGYSYAYGSGDNLSFSDGAFNEPSYD